MLGELLLLWQLQDIHRGLIEQKQLLGYPYRTSSRILRNFDAYCSEKFPDESTITRDIGLGWATLKEGEHQNNLLRRITPVRQLAKYMNSIGVEAYIIPPKIPKKQVRYVPHIYTASELTAFLSRLTCQPTLQPNALSDNTGIFSPSLLLRASPV